MNFIRQLWAFHKLSFGTLNPTAIAVYLSLFMENNSRNWDEWFEETDYWLKKSINVKRSETIVSALKLLKKRGFIDYVRGGMHRPTRYKLIPLNISGFESQPDSGLEEIPLNNRTIDRTIDRTITSTSNKQETKNKESKQPRPKKSEEPKTQYAEFVTLTQKEYSKLLDHYNGNVMAVKWCIETLNNYKGSTGRTYKSDYFAIRKWVLDAYSKNMQSKENQAPEYNFIDIEGIG